NRGVRETDRVGCGGRLERRIEGRVERRGKADRSQHAQRVLIEGGRRLEGRDDPARFEVGKAAPGEIEHTAIPIHQQRVDGEVTAHDIVFERARAYLRFTARWIVGLDAAGDEFQRA